MCGRSNLFSPEQLMKAILTFVKGTEIPSFPSNNGLFSLFSLNPLPIISDFSSLEAITAISSVEDISKALSASHFKFPYNYNLVGSILQGDVDLGDYPKYFAAFALSTSLAWIHSYHCPGICERTQSILQLLI